MCADARKEPLIGAHKVPGVRQVAGHTDLIVLRAPGDAQDAARSADPDEMKLGQTVNPLLQGRPIPGGCMSDLKLFRIDDGTAVELLGTALALEKPLQVLIERNMEVLFGVRFVASEHSTGKKHAGRIDSLGLDENGSPVIFEYKRSVNENVINQGLFYVDWLLDHRAEFELLVMKRFGHEAAEQIDWSSPRLVCVASDFTRYDEHAIAQINRSIELVRYRDYDGVFLTLDLMHLRAPRRPRQKAWRVQGAHPPASGPSRSCISGRPKISEISMTPSTPTCSRSATT